MLRTLVLGLVLLVCAPALASAEPPPSPDPYLAGPADAAGPPSLAGTRWRATMLWGEEVNYQWSWVEFLSDGQMNYGYTDGRTFDNGRWRQRGSVLVWDANAMFSVGLGTIEDARISGTRTNVRGEVVPWVFEREN